MHKIKYYRKLIAILTLFLLIASLRSTIPMVHASQIVSTWELDRPSSHVYLRDRVENASTNEDASVGIGVDVHAYEENAPQDPFNNNDGLILRVAATANTRKGINYTHTEYGHLVDGFPDPQYMESTEITGDNDGRWIDLHFGVYFYGGYGRQNESACYDKVWICSNGFLSFTSDSTSPYGEIPNPYEPNATIAVYWMDLDPSGGSIKYAKWDGADASFVVVWDNVENKFTGARETFGIIIRDEMYPHYRRRGQSTIRFLYKDVSWDNHAIIGLEDQEGYRGYTPFPDPASYPTGEDEVWLYADNDSPEIREMTIRVQKFNSDAEIKVSTDHNLLRGCNLDWHEMQEDPESVYEVAIKGGATLLSSTLIGAAIPYGGLILGQWLLTYRLVKAYARQNWPANYLDYKDADVNEEFAYVTASAAHLVEADWPVDANLVDTIYWVFKDQQPSTVEHSVKIYAELKYYSYKNGEIKTISTSVDLKMTPDICNDFSNPKTVYADTQYRGCLDNVDTADMYRINVINGYNIKVVMTPPRDANYDLYLYNPIQEEVKKSDNSGNATESIVHYFCWGGYWYIKVNQTYWPGHENNGIYKLTIHVWYSEQDRGGPCPFVYVWDGRRYVIDNNLLPTSEANNRTDVEDYYRLEQSLVPKYEGHQYSWYPLQIREFESEHSYFDQAKLMAVDHNSEVNIAVTPDGQVLTYKSPVAPLSAVDNNGTSRLGETSFVDGNVSDPATYFYGAAGDYLILNFGQVDSDNAKLILRDDMKCAICCIEVQVLANDGEWKTVTVLAPREYWSIEAVDLSPYVVEDQDFMVRLLWTTPHRLDYVGLDTTPQDDFELYDAKLVLAIHSTQGNVKLELSENDDIYAELIPGEQIQLLFRLPNNLSDTRTFIFYTEGHYYTIN